MWRDKQREQALLEARLEAERARQLEEEMRCELERESFVRLESRRKVASLVVFAFQTIKKLNPIKRNIILYVVTNFLKLFEIFLFVSPILRLMNGNQQGSVCSRKLLDETPNA